jgi:hypothetical protein
MVRKGILQSLEGLGTKVSDDLVQYFATMYEPASDLFVYSPGARIDVVKAAEGVRQGDKSASFLFCLRFAVAEAIKKKFKSCYGADAEIECFIYMDDGTFCVKPQHLHRLVEITNDTIAEMGFRVNLNKSSVLLPTETIASDFSLLPVQINPARKSFVALGGVINEVYDTFVAKLTRRHDCFFDMLNSLRVHPEIKHALLYFCGRPKLLHHASSNPPSQFGSTVLYFQRRMVEAFARIINCRVEDVADSPLLHVVQGGNLPEYAQNHAKLYEASKTAALANTPCQPVRLTKYLNRKGEIVSPDDDIASAAPQRVQQRAPHRSRSSSDDDIDDDQIDDQIQQGRAAARGDDNDDNESEHEPELHPEGALLYANTVKSFSWVLKPVAYQQMPPEFYRIALAMRLNLVPRDMGGSQGAITCCGKYLETDKAIINHATRCPKLARLSPAERHTLLKDHLACTIRRYGLSVFVEPGGYQYEDGSRGRPDLAVQIPGSSKRIVTDVSIVNPELRRDEDNELVEIPGRAAAKAAHTKIERHEKACQLSHHTFIPFVLETTGFFDRNCDVFIKSVARLLAQSIRRDFVRDVYGAAAAASAKMRAIAVFNAFNSDNPIRINRHHQ